MRLTTRVLRGYLLGGHIPTRGCLLGGSIAERRKIHCTSPRRNLDTQTSSSIAPIVDEKDNSTATTTPYRKLLRNESRKAKQAKKQKASKDGQSNKSSEVVDGWETTIGIEIHAQLNTQRKLFSSAHSVHSAPPNTSVAFFDLAIPGSLPCFQTATLIPAIRAALSLNCEIQKTSRFDRKHYFHWDQPAGYQITQFYSPFAKNGAVDLYKYDGIATEDGEQVKIGIKQIQMEQDTAKTITEPGDVHLLDFNRVGLPLIEIITTPCMHTPSTAAAFVRKVQILLKAVDACVIGMESGGLRADVNVSVRRVDDETILPLGTRTEIKNLSSFKSIHDAIIAERNRQITVLSEGGSIAGETRGWTIGSTETKRLRGKEGEIDYRYIPDADISPIIIGDDLIAYLKETMGVSPDEELSILTGEYGLTMKDALSLVALNGGGRVEYFYRVVDELALLQKSQTDIDVKKNFGRAAGNWVLHELGGLVDKETNSTPPPSSSVPLSIEGATDLLDPLRIDSSGSCIIPAPKLASIIFHLTHNRITGKTAKSLLQSIFHAHSTGLISEALDSGVEMAKSVDEMIEERGLWFQPLSEEQMRSLYREVLVGNEKLVEDIRRGREGKVMFLVGLMMKKGEKGRVDAVEAKRIIIEAVAEGGRDA